MKRLKLALTGFVMAIAITGCSALQGESAWVPSGNSVYIGKDLKVQSAMVYTSEAEQGQYDQAQLEQFAQSVVDEYNNQNASGEEKSVALTSTNIEGNKGTLVFSYDMPEDYVGFAELAGDDSHSITSILPQEVSQVAASSWDGVSLVDTNGSAVTLETVIQNTKLKSVEIQGVGTVEIEGTIRYMSSGVVANSQNQAQTAEGINIIIFE